MGVIGLIAALAATAVGTAHVIGALGPWRAAEAASGWILAFVTQLIGVAGVVGIGLAALRPVPMLLGALLVATAEVLVVRLRPGALARYRASQRGLLSAGGRGLRTLRHPVVLVLGLLVLAEYLWRTAIGALILPNDWDGNSYHIVGPAMWIQNGHIGHTRSNLWSDVYPQGQEVVSVWPGVFMHNLQWSAMAGIPFVLLGFTAVLSLALRFGVRRDYAALAALGFLAVPGVFAQVGTSYVDVAATTTALAAFQFVLAAPRFGTALAAHRGRFRHYWLAGLALAVATSVKTSNLLTLGLVGVVAAGQVVLAERAEGRRDGQGGLVRRLAVRLPQVAAALAVPSVLVSSYWYLRTLDAYGNPFWPFTMFGFKGQGTVQQLIMVHNTPGQVKGGSVLQQLWVSWTTMPASFACDERLGGLGAQWIFVLLPAIAIVFALGLWRRRGGALLFGLILPLFVMMLASPGPWWARYTLFLPAGGAVCLGVLLTELAGRREQPGDRTGFARRTFAGVVAAAFVAVTAVPMYVATAFATVPPTIEVMQHREKQMQSVWPWWSYPATHGNLAKGSTVAITQDFPEIRLPLIGLHMERRMVQVRTSLDLPTTIAWLRNANARYIALNPNVWWDQQLIMKMSADREHFRLVSGGDEGPVFEVGDFR